MTPEERQMLTDLANKIAQTPAPQRDPEAEEFIKTRIGNRPDALYILTQTVLIQNIAIEHAQQEIEQWKQRFQQGAQQTPQQPGQGSFLGRGGGWGATPQQPQPAPPQPQYAPPSPQYAPPSPQYAPPQPQAPPQGGGGLFGGGGGSGMGSFLRSAGTTAAGVAAGALAFEGIRSMFGGAEHLFGGGGGFGGGGPRVEETVVNNYYEGGPGDAPAHEHRGFADTDLGPSDSVDYSNTDVPVSDSLDDSTGFDDSSLDDSSSDTDDSV